MLWVLCVAEFLSLYLTASLQKQSEWPVLLLCQKKSQAGEASAFPSSGAMRNPALTKATGTTGLDKKSEKSLAEY